jgi:hypothetical protein
MRPFTPSWPSMHYQADACFPCGGWLPFGEVWVGNGVCLQAPGGWFGSASALTSSGTVIRIHMRCSYPSTGFVTLNVQHARCPQSVCSDRSSVARIVSNTVLRGGCFGFQREPGSPASSPECI